MLMPSIVSHAAYVSWLDQQCRNGVANHPILYNLVLTRTAVKSILHLVQVSQPIVCACARVHARARAVATHMRMMQVLKQRGGHSMLIGAEGSGRRASLKLVHSAYDVPMHVFDAMREAKTMEVRYFASRPLGISSPG